MLTVNGSYAGLSAYVDQLGKPQTAPQAPFTFTYICVMRVYLFVSDC